jgi:hypothetical protein
MTHVPFMGLDPEPIAKTFTEGAYAGQTSPKGRQHDDHCAAQELELSKDWKDWPADPSQEDIYARLAASLPIPQARYVIARSDCIENQYWAAKPGARWRPLAEAEIHTRETLNEDDLPPDGFWMPLDRARELEA